MKILISYWYEINPYHVLPTNRKASWFPDWFSMSTSPVAQKCKPHQPQSLWSSVITESHLKCVLQSIKTENGEALWSSVLLWMFTWSRYVYRAELQTSAQSLQLHTLKLQCATYCTRYCQPHRLSDNRTPDPSFCSFSLTAHTAEMPCNQLQPPFPWAQHAPSFTPKCWSAEEEPTPHVGMSCYTTLQIRRIHMTI